MDVVFMYVSPSDGKLWVMTGVCGSSEPGFLRRAFINVLLDQKGVAFVHEVLAHRVDIIVDGSPVTYWDPVSKDWKLS